VIDLPDLSGGITWREYSGGYTACQFVMRGKDVELELKLPVDLQITAQNNSI
jgi:hypothetical protein